MNSEDTISKAPNPNDDIVDGTIDGDDKIR